LQSAINDLKLPTAELHHLGFKTKEQKESEGLTPQETSPSNKESQGKGRMSCEGNSIGATGAKPPLLAKTTICVGARIVQPAQS